MPCIMGDSNFALKWLYSCSKIMIYIYTVLMG